MACSLCELNNLRESNVRPKLIVEIADEVDSLQEPLAEGTWAAHPNDENTGSWRTTARRRSSGPVDGAVPEGIRLISRYDKMGDTAKWKETEHTHRQAGDVFARVFHANPAINCIIHLNDRRYIEINKAYEQHTGYSRAEIIGEDSIGLGLWNNPDDREHVFGKLVCEGSIREYQCNSLTKAGSPLVTLVSGEIMEFGDELCALITAEDITVRIQAETASLELDRRLMNAQEVERRRIARELHDSIGQSLALFSIQLERARLLVKGISKDGDARLKELCGKITDLGKSVSDLSHQLHSSELELLGLSAAVTSLCREFSEQYPVEVDCVCSDIPGGVGSDVSLGLYRVMQEALHNIAKHSRARKIHVELRGAPESVCLTIVDDGIGFSLDNPIRRPGLGLISMHERMHLINGDFTIRSKPNGGTRIEAIAPLHETLYGALASSELQETCSHTCFRKVLNPDVGSAGQIQD